MSVGSRAKTKHKMHVLRGIWSNPFQNLLVHCGFAVRCGGEGHSEFQDSEFTNFQKEPNLKGRRDTTNIAIS